MKLVASNQERDVLAARRWPFLRQRLRDAAANLLRVVRGAGKPGALGHQFQKVIDQYVEFGEISGLNPAPKDVAKALTIWQAVSPEQWRASFEREVADEDFDRWIKDGSYDIAAAREKVIRASLQIAAARLLYQQTQERTAEHELFVAIKEFNCAQEKYVKVFRQR